MNLVEQNDNFLTDIKENFKAQTATEVEVPPCVNFTKILRAAFSYESVLSSFSLLRARFVFFWQKKIGAKAARKMLVKLPQECINCFCECEFKWAEKRKSQIMHQIAKSRTTNSSHLLFCHQNSWLIRGSTFSLSLHLSFSRFNNIQSSHSMIGSGSFTLCLSFCLSMFLLLLILSLGLSASVIRIFLTFSHPPSTFCPSFLPLAVYFSLLLLYFYLYHFRSLIESVFFFILSVSSYFSLCLCIIFIIFGSIFLLSVSLYFCLSITYLQKSYICISVFLSFIQGIKCVCMFAQI